MDNIPEFHETDAAWEASEGAGQSEYDGMKRQYDAIVDREKAPARQMHAMLQRVANFNFLETLDASPSPKAREAYTQLMVDLRVLINDTKRSVE